MRTSFCQLAWSLAFAGAVCTASGCDASAVPPVEIIVSGDTAGWIVPCGCTSNQSGGLLRRGTLVAQRRARAEVIVVDVGGSATGGTPYDRAKLDAIQAGAKEMGLVAQNIGAAEAELGSKTLLQLAAQGVPLLSANVLGDRGETIAKPILIQSAGGQRIAFVGVLSPSMCPAKVQGLQVSPPKEAVLKTLREASGKFDRVVVLAYLPEEELLELAASLPEVDAVIGGPTGQSIAPRRVGPTLVAAATNKGKFVALLKVPPRGAAVWSGEVVELDQQFTDDPKQKRNLDQFYSRLAESDFAPNQTPFAPRLPVELPQNFRVAGSGACRECHPQAFAAWDKSSHAKAWVSLEKTGAHVDADCQRCHSTDFGYPGGFVSARQSAERVGVGCESCHGPSAAHARDPAEKTAWSEQAGNQCVHCHDRENSPEFEFAKYWPHIVHGAEQ